MAKICEKSRVSIKIPQKLLRKWFWTSQRVPPKIIKKLAQKRRVVREARLYLQHVESVIDRIMLKK